MIPSATRCNDASERASHISASTWARYLCWSFPASVRHGWEPEARRGCGGLCFPQHGATCLRPARADWVLRGRRCTCGTKRRSQYSWECHPTSARARSFPPPATPATRSGLHRVNHSARCSTSTPGDQESALNRSVSSVVGEVAGPRRVTVKAARSEEHTSEL